MGRLFRLELYYGSDWPPEKVGKLKGNQICGCYTDDDELCNSIIFEELGDTKYRCTKCGAKRDTWVWSSPAFKSKKNYDV